jgi:hypothetical protein
MKMASNKDMMTTKALSIGMKNQEHIILRSRYRLKFYQ